MPRRHFPHLDKLLYLGFHGGFRWETQGFDQRDAETGVICRALAPDTANKGRTSQALSQIYDWAAENVGMCGLLEPEDFLACAKDSFEWSAKFRDDAFWAFTYKLFHARELFVAPVYDPMGKTQPRGHPLLTAPDNFRQEFLTRYDIHSKTYQKYFPRELTHADGEGDGDDKLFIVPVAEASKLSEDYAAQTAEVDQPNEPTIGFYDFGPRYRDGYEDVKAKAAADEKAKKAKPAGILDEAIVGDDEDDIMMDLDDDEAMNDLAEGVEKKLR
ncbi:Uu.00g128710.m01.CDS01 [Anthostomella pinea]|uniref:Uu.00g128710.m01.CDS01 n=1 Tax=Anthostomella pinea TaxID=933095 RepID=A0AAI8YI49_9PEZI|nr:Uu.00g128710.m01.CDS01 [Anthostomella pinea]